MKEGPPELMSPAGGWSQLRAAVSNGADAVYLGLTSYSARARATNFDPNPELIFRRHRRRPGEYGEFDDEYDDDEQDESTVAGESRALLSRESRARIRGIQHPRFR